MVITSEGRDRAMSPTPGAGDGCQALPTFVWVKLAIRMVTNEWETARKSGIFRALGRIEIEPSAMKEDGRLQMLPIPEAIGVFLIV